MPVSDVQRNAMMCFQFIGTCVEKFLSIEFLGMTWGSLVLGIVVILLGGRIIHSVYGLAGGASSRFDNLRGGGNNNDSRTK